MLAVDPAQAGAQRRGPRRPHEPVPLVQRAAASASARGPALGGVGPVLGRAEGVVGDEDLRAVGSSARHSCSGRVHSCASQPSLSRASATHPGDRRLAHLGRPGEHGEAWRSSSVHRARYARVGTKTPASSWAAATSSVERATRLVDEALELAHAERPRARAAEPAGGRRARRRAGWRRRARPARRPGRRATWPRPGRARRAGARRRSAPAASGAAARSAAWPGRDAAASHSSGARRRRRWITISVGPGQLGQARRADPVHRGRRGDGGEDAPPGRVPHAGVVEHGAAEPLEGEPAELVQAVGRGAHTGVVAGSRLARPRVESNVVMTTR